jgi:hypothetical protein
VKATSDDASVFATAFKHDTNATSTIILINSSEEDKKVTFSGEDIPGIFNMYRTTSAYAESCSLIEDVNSGLTNTFILPARSMVTLQAGGDPL